MSLGERLRARAGIARERLDEGRFEEFCSDHLPHLDQVADEFFGSGTARDAIHQKLRELYPADEIEEFTELIWQRVQKARAEEER